MPQESGSQQGGLAAALHAPCVTMLLLKAGAVRPDQIPGEGAGLCHLHVLTHLVPVCLWGTEMENTDRMCCVLPEAGRLGDAIL